MGCGPSTVSKDSRNEIESEIDDTPADENLPNENIVEVQPSENIETDQDNGEENAERSDEPKPKNIHWTTLQNYVKMSKPKFEEIEL